MTEPANQPQPTPAPDLRAALGGVRAEVAKAVVGQDAVINGILIALLCRGHILLEGVPGTAKTLMVRSMAAALSVSQGRIQFTPDLMPSDVTGSPVFDTKESEFVFRPGPIFANLVLADEINRTPPKTQAGLLEAMEERRVTSDGKRYALPEPFCVAATQNPVEQQGTYELPEAQLDRFLLKVVIDLPDRDTETQLLDRHAKGFDPSNLTTAGIQPVMDAAMIGAASAQVEQVAVDAQVIGYIVDICRATRSAPSLSLGASPRGATALLKTSRAWAWIMGRDFVTPDDVKTMAPATLVHRLHVRRDGSEGSGDATVLLQNILSTVPVPR